MVLISRQVSSGQESAQITFPISLDHFKEVRKTIKDVKGNQGDEADKAKKDFLNCGTEVNIFNYFEHSSRLALALEGGDPKQTAFGNLLPTGKVFTGHIAHHSRLCNIMHSSS